MTRLPDLSVKLVEAALAMWSANDWHVYDQMEVNYTGQLYRWLVAAKRSNLKYALLEVHAEDLVFTQRMILGLDSCTSARRVDLRIAVGDDAGIYLEAKRLASKGSWCQEYVHEGIARFVSSAYGAGEHLGMMIGYVQQSRPDGLLQKVNSYVCGHQLMGASHQLGSGAATTFGPRFMSDHERVSDIAIRLIHIWVVK